MTNEGSELQTLQKRLFNLKFCKASSPSLYIPGIIHLYKNVKRGCVSIAKMIGLQVSTYLSISKLHCAECSRTVFIPFASIDFSVRGLPSTGPKCHNQLSKERICCHLIGESSQILSIISTAYEGHLWRQAKFQLFIISHPSIRKGFTIHSLWNSVMSADPMKCPLNLVLSDNGAAYKRKFVIW